MNIKSNLLKIGKVSVFLLMFFNAPFVAASNNIDQMMPKQDSTISKAEGISWDDINYIIRRPQYLLYEALSFFGLYNSQSQYEFNEKLTKYLQSGLSKIEREKIERIVKEIRTGCCGGYASLWLYYKWLDTNPNGFADNKCSLAPEIKDKEWLQYCMDILNKWDNDKSLSLTEEDKAKIDEFIELLDFFQAPYQSLSSNINQGELNNSLRHISKIDPTEEYCFSANLTVEQLKKVLKTENFLQNNRMIYIHCGKHITALFKNGDDYYYFDVTNPQGEVKLKSTDEVAEWIRYAHMTPSIFFKMFSFDKKNYPIPLKANY